MRGEAAGVRRKSRTYRRRLDPRRKIGEGRAGKPDPENAWPRQIRKRAGAAPLDMKRRTRRRDFRESGLEPREPVAVRVVTEKSERQMEPRPPRPAHRVGAGDLLNLADQT